MQNINNKIKKYIAKLNNTEDKNKKNIYEQKLFFYKKLILKGGLNYKNCSNRCGHRVANNDFDVCCDECNGTNGPHSDACEFWNDPNSQRYIDQLFASANDGAVYTRDANTGLYNTTTGQPYNNGILQLEQELEILEDDQVEIEQRLRDMEARHARELRELGDQMLAVEQRIERENREMENRHNQENEQLAAEIQNLRSRLQQ